ncbi:MAG: hypothetical protein K1X31_14270 [Gemmatimonadaceae bacterium]|nr:hypothetical protein [Gemmatimonadaceae bacterium]
MPRAARLLLPAFVLCVAAPLGARAQDAAALVVTVADAAPTGSASTGPTGLARGEIAGAHGPARFGLRTGVAPAEQATASPAPMPMRGDTKRSRTLMIVGGAAFLGGAIIGGDAGKIVMLGGLGVGIYGLYLHLQ